ncbi:MAG: hypothetical protein ABI024_11805 [Vicinamibacterales bacterium]
MSLDAIEIIERASARGYGPAINSDNIAIDLADSIDLLHVFPAMAEALTIIAISRFKDPSKLSCCAE